MDGTLRGTSILKNIFFTVATNPFMKIEENTEQVHCTDHIVQKIAMFQVNSLAKTYFLNPIRCIALSIALTYYFRLPTKENNLQRNDKKLPAREQLTKLLGQAIPNFDYIVQNELERFVNLSISDFYSIQLREIPIEEQEFLRNIETKARSFIDHFGKEYFYGFNNETLYSYLLSFIKRNTQDEPYLSNIHENYNQLAMQSKPFIE
ncbi:unnamed protein product [Rotaria sp. Silwood1]|nr:unnamed protein product [Rotaria sp. Silwood1]